MKVFIIEVYPQDEYCVDPANDEKVLDFISKIEWSSLSYNRIKVLRELDIAKVKALAVECDVVINVLSSEIVLDLYNNKE